MQKREEDWNAARVPRLFFFFPFFFALYRKIYSGSSFIDTDAFRVNREIFSSHETRREATLSLSLSFSLSGYIRNSHRAPATEIARVRMSCNKSKLRRETFHASRACAEFTIIYPPCCCSHRFHCLVYVTSGNLLIMKNQKVPQYNGELIN